MIHVAPDPLFPGFNRAHEGMFALLKMLGSVLVLRRVTASDVPALQAHAEVDPPVADLDAVFTDMLVRIGELDLVRMGTFHAA